MPDIGDSRILIVATDGFEQDELLVPQDKLKRAGASVDIAAPKARQTSGKIYGWNKTDWGKTVSVDVDLENVDPGDYDALVLPGGQINPDKLRVDDTALGVIKSFASSGKVIAAICHAPWLLIEADLVRGRKLTSFKSIRTDVINAGGECVTRRSSRTTASSRAATWATSTPSCRRSSRRSRTDRVTLAARLREE